ncbi:hypothetical protein EG68_10831 [Paragonimus skrjabini miyazakii]|uniref:Uncharacterized protein n=1 Tax=Paragonimus skrjabini miyazakii TaxID=59628 RepID=A0A8S9YLV9_9TREM|nr:hypothetical protein EG68_10831 [Paragonimus skrjabini miyazakii]
MLSLNQRLRRLAAEQDDPAALSDIVADDLPVVPSADRGITVVDAPVVNCEPHLTIKYAGKDESIPTVEIQGIYLVLDQIIFRSSTSGGQPADEFASTMPGLRVRYSSGDNFPGSILDDILATYMHCNMSLTKIDRLLRMLDFYFPHLPFDPRTVLRTPWSNELCCIGVTEHVHLDLIA